MPQTAVASASIYSRLGTSVWCRTIRGPMKKPIILPKIGQVPRMPVAVINVEEDEDKDDNYVLVVQENQIMIVL